MELLFQPNWVFQHERQLVNMYCACGSRPATKFPDSYKILIFEQSPLNSLFQEAWQLAK